MSLLWAGFLVGLAGSAHCAVMCGPLVAATAPRGARALIHHTSRILIYALFGTVAGLAGSSAARAGAGQIVAMLSAAGLLAQAWLRWRSSAPSFPSLRLTSQLSSALHSLRLVANRHPHVAAIGVGVVNGLLPCGLVYGALMASAGLGGPITGAGFMIAFGIGTVPLVVMAAGTAGVIRRRLPALDALAPAALVIVAILVAIRGWSAMPPLPHGH